MSMHLHRSNQTKVLRSAAVSRCKYCGVPVEWFDRHDGMRIPLTCEFPTRCIPARMRWHVDRGVAYPGHDTSSQYCRIPHPAVCPATDHPDLPPPLQDVVRRLAIRMRTGIDNGTFIPPPVETETETDAESPGPDQVQHVRHVINCHGSLRIGPGPIEELQCIARDSHTEQRCENGICDLTEGRWELTSINPDHATGRQGQQILDLTGGSIWAWHLTDFTVVRRWWAQRCHAHFGTDEPDHVANEFVPFHPLRHDAHVLTQRPDGYDLPGVSDGRHDIRCGPEERVKCATPTCSNSTVTSPHKGWLCWQCEKLQQRRERTHRRWNQLLPDDQPG
ncbi:DUF6083 domain-containing protein [Streptomyces sp. NPDC002225]|uniref:DUF6083 domain-containing protein n=1 Tax=Streptomyces sp. NPDC002225 TaxID=3154413 RepID=UPI00332A0337